MEAVAASELAVFDRVVVGGYVARFGVAAATFGGGSGLRVGAARRAQFSARFALRRGRVCAFSAVG